ncbi:DUF7344 domain-containing protein [Halobacterium wangiae]|uniref:DUF7344 domain-containing protein n=1 Tax=Halobacterium wangiae TaxID=2902623 RepID=UPI001E4E80E6|nr:hypothetical protein [Halobacterium wangiae]
MTYSGGRPGDSGPDATSARADSQPSVDALLDVLADAHRRFLVEFLREQPAETCSFAAAIDHVVARAEREREEQLDHDDVELQFYHRHLPKLADAGLLEYDTRSETIRYRPNERLELLFDGIQELRTD